MRSLTFVFGCILTAAIPLTARCEDPRSFGLVDRLPGEDASCDVVNRAYQKMVDHGRVSQTVYEWTSDDERHLWTSYRYVQNALYGQQSSKQWYLYPRPYFLTTNRGAPVLTKCTFVADVAQEGRPAAQFSAHWERGPYSAEVKLWIGNDRKIFEIERHFERGKSPFPFDDSVDVYDDDPRISIPADERPVPLDPTCTEINSAYERTVNTPRYTYWISQLKSDGKRVRALDGRVVDHILFTRPHGGNWERTPFPVERLAADSGPLFQSCQKISSSPEEEYFTAKWHKIYWTIPIEIWVSPKTGKFLRTIRDYGHEPQEFYFPIALQVFNYDATKATVPPTK